MISNVSATPVSVSAPNHQSTHVEANRDDSSAPIRGSDENGSELSDDELKQVRELQARDREVRAHEQAHLAAAGGLAQGGATFTYERGPDQKLYAVGGEVQVDTSEVAGDPAATLRKAQTIRRAALAPVSPSAQDRTAAASATRMAAEARAQIIADAASGDKPDPADGTHSSSLSEQAEASAGCPACGGAHASHAHAGMTAYAKEQEPDLVDNAATLSATV